MKPCEVIFGVLVLIAVLSCTGEIGKSDVVGEFIANHGNGKDRLLVLSDGTYSHEYVSSDGERFNENGRWELDEIGDEVVVSFYGFTHKWRGEFPLRGIWPAAVGRRFGRTVLWLSRDRGYYFEKQVPKQGDSATP